MSSNVVKNKTRNKALAAAALLAVAAGAAATARAQSTASASISGFHVELLDLAPGDGMTPALSFTGRSSLGEALAYVSPFSSMPVLRDRAQLDGGPGTASVENEDGSALARVTGELLETAVSVTAEAFSAHAMTTLQFTLTPHTRATFAWTAASSILIGGQRPDPAASLVPETAVILFGHVRTPDGRSAGFNSDTRPMPGEHSFPVSGIGYTGDLAATGDIELQVAALGRVAPIPEPAHWTMLLAGLGLFGAARHANKASKNEPGRNEPCRAS